MAATPSYGDLALALRFAIAALLTMAVAGKLIAPKRFIAGLRQWDLIPDPLVTIAALAAIGLESTTVILLAKDETVRLGIYAAAAIFAIFLIGAVVTLARRRSVECHCFDVLGSETLTATSVVRLAVCLLAALCATLIPGGYAAADPIPAATVGAGFVMLILYIGAARTAWLGYTEKPRAGHRDGGRVSFRLAAGDGLE
jgi:hypothetical protein